MGNHETKPKHCFEIKNVLILGATGAGKSTLINSIPNLYKYKDYKTLLKSREEIILIKGEFEYLGDPDKPVSINYEPNVELNERFLSRVERRNKDIAADITQFTQSYLFKLDDCWIRLIDTPGMMDVRGPEKDEHNLKEIIDYIAQYESLEAIIIVSRNDESRQTVSFRYSIEELLIHLHRDACKNIIFAFTQTSSNDFKCGNTLSALREFLKILQDKSGVDVPTTGDNIFCFDNIWFRDMMLLRNGISANNHNLMKICFDKNKQELTRLINKIKSNEPHKIMDTVCLNRARCLIFFIYQPLGAVAKTLMQNISRVDKALYETFQQNSGQIGVEKIVTKVVRRDEPATVCTSCSEDCQVEGKTRKRYKECHQNCGIIGVVRETIPHEKLRYCRCMGNSEEDCVVCGCRWDKHMHSRYMMFDEVQVEHVTSNNDGKTFFENMKNQNSKELEMIKEYGSLFCVYIKQQSIASTSDSYLDYLKFLKVQEINEHGNSELTVKLDEMISEHQQQIQLIEREIIDGTQKPKTAEEINKMLDELFALPIAGPILRKVRDLEINRLREEGQINDDVIINL